MKKNKFLLLFSWIVSIIATSGSLYFSEAKGFIPCEFCWYQRILMYPLVLILGIGFFRKELQIKFYVLPFSILGMLIAGYHYFIQMFPMYSSSTQCSGSVPCIMKYIEWFGFITIPFLSLVAFTLITITLLFVKTKSDK